MSETAALLDRAQERFGLTSDNKLAQALNWPQGTISGYRRGARTMDIEMAVDFATKTGIPLEEVAAAAIADKKALKPTSKARKGQIALPLKAA